MLHASVALFIYNGTMCITGPTAPCCWP